MSTQQRRIYTDARESFRHMSTPLGARAFASMPNGGEDTTTDVMVLGKDAPRNMLLVIAGTHGVEGFLGSAIMRAWGNTQPTLPENTQVLLIHALNAWGIRNGRRVTQENVDPNRNFHRRFQQLPMNPDYDRLRGLLEPKQWGPTAPEETDAALRAYAEEHGMPALLKAVVSGQYKSSKGIFYGGTGASKTGEVLGHIMVQMVPESLQRLGVLDIHTGLGRWAEVEMLCPWPDESDELARAIAWYDGHAVRSPLAGKSVATMVAGDMLSFIASRFPDTQTTAVAAEFGTYDVFRVLTALIGENAVTHHYGDMSPEHAKAKTELLEVFAPSVEGWWSRCTDTGVQLINQALAAISKE